MSAKRSIPVVILVSILCISFINASYVEGETLLELTLTTNDSATRMAAAYSIQESWEAIGINVTVDIIDWGTYIGAILAKPPGYQIGVLGFSSTTYHPDLSGIYHSTGTLNIFGPWEDTYNDDLLDELLVTAMPEDRQALYHDWQENLMDELPCIPLYSPQDVYARRAAIENYHPQYGTFYPSLTSTDGTTNLVIAKNNDYLMFNPLNVTMSSQIENFASSLDGLYTYDLENNIVPHLAVDDPVVSSDGLTWTIVLRDDIFWQDGEQFDAEDVYFSVMAYSDPGDTLESGLSGHTNPRVYNAFESIVKNGNLEGNISILSQFIVQFKLPEVHSTFLSSDLMTYMLPEHLLNVSDSDSDGSISDEPAWTAYQNGDHFIGTAGYYFSSDNWVEGSQYEFTLRTDPTNPYWNTATPETDVNNQPFDITWITEAYEIEQITNRIIPVINDQINEFEAGNIDFVEIEANYTYLIPDYVANPNYEVTYQTASGVIIVNFNLNDPIFSADPAKGKILRKALAHALDKEAVTEAATNGTGIVCDNPLSPALIYNYHWDNPFNYEYNSTLATELLYIYLDYVVSELGILAYSFLIFGVMSSGCLVLFSRKK
ncbi:MAG: ABC transporter substrate-binding protein [Candidatus Kariarchaeaceae archaeon]